MYVFDRLINLNSSSENRPDRQIFFNLKNKRIKKMYNIEHWYPQRHNSENRNHIVPLKYTTLGTLCPKKA